MNYSELIKQSFQITWKNKFLWYFGLFTGGIVLNIPSFNYQFGESEISSINSLGTFDGLRSFYFDHQLIIYILLGIVLVLSLVIWIFSVISQGAIINGVYTISQNRSISFKNAFLAGWHNFWRLLILGILILLIFLITLVVFALPVLVLALTGLIIPAIIMGIFLVLAYIIFALILSLCFNYSYRILIVENVPILASINLGVVFFKKYWKNIALILLISLGIGLAWGLVLIFSMLIFLGLLFGIGLLLYFAIKTYIWIYIIIASIVFIVPLIIISAGYNTFISSLWTLSYVKLNKEK